MINERERLRQRYEQELKSQRATAGKYLDEKLQMEQKLGQVRVCWIHICVLLVCEGFQFVVEGGIYVEYVSE